MQLSRSNCVRGSSRRKRQTSTRSAAGTTTNGSMPSSVFLTRSGNFSSRTAAISAGVMVTRSGFGRCGLFLGLAGEGVLLLDGLLRVGVAQLRRQKDVAGPRRDRHLQRLAARQVLH